MVILPEFRRTTSFPFSEDSVEVAQVIKPTTITDFSNRVCAIHKHPTGITQTEVYDILAEITTRMEFKETAEGRRTHAGEISHLCQTDFFLIMLVDETLHLLYPSTITGYLHLCKAAGCQCPRAVAFGEFVENFQKLHEGMESVLNATERI